ncbi:MAG: hypothetical protein KDE47_22860 [Caldilineaceae bacterium]|nr:hypothetical protein [Caldilineaceae bacterium]
MSKVTGGEAIVQSLIAHGVDTLFGLPGVQNDWLYNALYDQRDKIRVIHTRHEQGAGYMALGYALARGDIGVCSVVPGPGLLNAGAALATAYGLNAQVLYLVGQIPTAKIGKGEGQLHEIPNQLSILRSLTKWAERIDRPADAPRRVAEAFQQLRSGRPRPVGLEAPMDVLAAKAEVDLAVVEHDIRHALVDPEALEEAAKLLGNAQNPLIFVGSGAIEAAPYVQQLAETLQAPVVSSRSGHGILSSRHYLAVRTTAGHRLWEKADVVLAIGTRLQNPQVTWGTDDELKIIRVDVDQEEINRYPAPTLSLVARSEDVLPQLLPAVEKQNRKRESRREEMEALQGSIDELMTAIEPQMTFIRVLRDELPDDGIYVDDLTQVGYVSRVAFPVYKPRTYLSAGYQGTLGWGFATALGAKVANPNKAVLSISGDGGFMFNVQELATAVQHKINTVSVVFNDSAYGNVRRMQRYDHGNRLIATELKNPDFVKLAEAFDMQGLRANGPDELRSALRTPFAHNGPTLIEVPVAEMPNPRNTYWLPRIRPRKG